MKYNYVLEAVEKTALDKDPIVNIVQSSKGKKDEKADPIPEKEKKTAKSIIQEAVEKGNYCTIKQKKVKIVDLLKSISPLFFICSNKERNEGMQDLVFDILYCFT